jgi:hypothetical protein
MPQSYNPVPGNLLPGSLPTATACDRRAIAHIAHIAQRLPPTCSSGHRCGNARTGSEAARTLRVLFAASYVFKVGCI